MKCVRSFLLLLLCAATSVAFSDDGWWSTAGGIGAYGKGHPTIRMVSEDLKIQIVDDQTAKVNVLFSFRNEGKATQVTMAFPESYEMREGKSLDKFRTWVDGKLVSARRVILSKGDLTDEDVGDRIGKAVWLKKVIFAANQTLSVRVAYEGHLSGNTSGDRTFSYTLTTGATWKGPIGSCKITVTWPKKSDLCTPCLSLLPAKWQYLNGQTAVATLLNWRPKDDLTMEMVPGFGNFWINGKHLSGTNCKSYFKTTILGSAGDPIFRSASANYFFGEVDPIGLSPKPKRWFSEPFEISKDIVTLHSGKKVKLPRGYKVFHMKDENFEQRDDEYVYLKDLVEALGGKYRYDPVMNWIQITF